MFCCVKTSLAIFLQGPHQVVYASTKIGFFSAFAFALTWLQFPDSNCIPWENKFVPTRNRLSINKYAFIFYRGFCSTLLLFTTFNGMGMIILLPPAGMVYV